MSDPEERARHLALGTEHPDADVARTLEEAAATVRRRGALAAAGQIAEQSSRCTPPEEKLDVARRTMQAAEYHLDSGDPARARILLEGLLPDIPAGGMRAVALQRLGWARYHEEGWAAAERLFEEAVTDVGVDGEISATLALDRSMAALLSGDLPRAAVFARSALDSAEARGDQGLVGDALAVAGSVAFLSGEGVPLEQMGRAVDIETWSRPRPTAAHPAVTG